MERYKIAAKINGIRFNSQEFYDRQRAEELYNTLKKISDIITLLYDYGFGWTIATSTHC